MTATGTVTKQSTKTEAVVAAAETVILTINVIKDYILNNNNKQYV